MWDILDQVHPCIGIDLGTTNSVVAICDESKPKIIKIDGKALTRSIVGENSSFKRHMHTPLKKLKEGKTPVELSAELLKHLKEKAEKVIGKRIKKAVITVPAYFDEVARKSTIEAASHADIEVIRLLNEPTAAALAYNFTKDGIYAVYDLGGGTFDISILKKQGDVFQVLATGGDTRLGGDDVDENIACHLSCSVQEAKARKENLTIDFATLKKLSCPLVDRTLSICRQVLDDACMDVSDLDGVILVGGCTRLLGLKEKIFEFFKQEPLDDLDPDTIVALGASMQAEVLLGKRRHLLLDVVPMSLGIETLSGKVDVFIARNTPIPISVYQDMTTFIDNQKAIDFHVVQGESPDVIDCKTLAKFSMSDLPKLPAGELRVRVGFSVDQNGMLKVNATCNDKFHEVLIRE